MTLPAVVTETSATSGNARLIQSVRSLYQTDHQEEFLHLQIQIESLLTELLVLQHERQVVSPVDSAPSEP